MSQFTYSGTASDTAAHQAMQLQNAGRFSEAETAWRKLLAIQGEDPTVLRHLGESCFFQKHYSEAEKFFRRAIALNRDGSTLCALSCALGGLGRVDEALQILEEACKRDPDNPTIWMSRANALASQSKAGEALEAYCRAAKLDPNLFPAYFNAGNMLIKQNRHAEAEPFYRKALSLNPQHPGALNNLGNVLMISDTPEEAIPVFEAAIRVSPDFAKPYYNLGHALAKAERHREAISMFRKAVALDPDYVRAWDKLGMSLQATDQIEAATEAFSTALKRKPDLASARFGIASCLQIQGDFEGAHRETRKAIALAPNRPFYWNALVMTKKFRDGDPDVAAVEALAAKADTFSGADQPRVFFMLGKVYSDLGRDTDAFAAWQQGNARMRAQMPYNENRELATMRRIAEIFSADFLAQRAGHGVASELPVFIVGMPRSGSSLVEQILASHSGIFGAGELTDFSRLFAKHVCNGPPAFSPEQLTDVALHDLGQSYLDALAAHAPDARRITDKMPGNFCYTGLIRLALPGAKIIHVHRDAADCCLSCYTKQFISGQPFTYDLTDLGHFYRAYETLMAHWRAVLPPDVFMDVEYEALVEDFDTVARKIIAFCGLEWQDACHDFYKTSRIVRTASQTQVREPLYTGSIGRWRRYEKELAPLFSALKA